MAKKPKVEPWDPKNPIPQEVYDAPLSALKEWICPNVRGPNDSPWTHELNWYSIANPIHEDKLPSEQRATVTAPPEMEINPWELSEEQAAALPEEKWLDFHCPNHVGTDGRMESSPFNRISHYVRTGQAQRDAEVEAKRLKIPERPQQPEWFAATSDGKAQLALYDARVVELRHEALRRLADVAEREAKEHAPIVAARWQAQRDFEAESSKASIALRVYRQRPTTENRLAQRHSHFQYLVAQDALQFAIRDNLASGYRFERERGELLYILRETAPANIREAVQWCDDEIAKLRQLSTANAEAVGRMLQLQRIRPEILALNETVVTREEAEVQIKKIKRTIPPNGKAACTPDEMYSLGYWNGRFK